MKFRRQQNGGRNDKFEMAKCNEWFQQRLAKKVKKWEINIIYYSVYFRKKQAILLRMRKCHLNLIVPICVLLEKLECEVKLPEGAEVKKGKNRQKKMMNGIGKGIVPCI